MQRTLDHHQKKCRNRTDKRSKHRNDIGYSNDNRNQYRIWDMQNQTSKITDYSDDGRIYNLSNDETTKYFICLVETSIIMFPCFGLKIAYTIFLLCPTRLSLMDKT